MEYPLKGIYDHKGRFHQSAGISAILMIDTGGLLCVPDLFIMNRRDNRL